MGYKTDIEIAREANKKPIQEIGAKLGIPSDDLLPFGHDKAKVSEEFIKAQKGKQDGKLILVTAINPTPAGEGKTTTTVEVELSDSTQTDHVVIQRSTSLRSGSGKPTPPSSSFRSPPTAPTPRSRPAPASTRCYRPSRE